MMLRQLKLIGFSCLLVASLSGLAQTPVGGPSAGVSVITTGQLPVDAGSAGANEPVRIVNTPPGATGMSREGAGVKPSFAPPPVAAPPNEFQKFVLEGTGNLLPIYGADFFAAARGYAPLQGTPVSGDYPLGPGDEVLIRGWGSVEIDYRAVIDRNGMINIPKVGSVMLAGVRAANAEDVIRLAVNKVFRGFTLNVTLGQLRGITVYVVGQARRPGTYMVSSLSTIVTALFESGGPAANGSLRRVQVKRAGTLVAELDLYAFLARGDKSADIRLLDGDVILIPPAHGFVALTGKVETPAIYELKGINDTVQSLLDVAGGLPVIADPRRVYIERIDPTLRLPRHVDDFALDAAGLAKELKNGDLVSIPSITGEFANAVTLRGSVSQTLRVPYRKGMKIRDLIPSKDFLLSRSAIRRQNDVFLEKSVVDAIGNRYDEFNWDYAVVERKNRADLTESLVPFNLGRALADADGPDNLALEASDIVTVFSADDVRIPIAKRKVFVRLEGEIRRPGVYQVSSGETLINMIEKAGGLTPDAYLFGAEFGRESVRKSQQDNMEAFIRRVEQQGLSESAKTASNITETTTASANALQLRLAAQAESRTRLVKRMRELKSSGRISLGLPMKEASLANFPSIALENGDRLTVPSRPSFVQIIGAVSTEAAMLWQPGRAISDYLAMAGMNADADVDNVLVMRADGSVTSNAGRWMSSVSGLESMPGDILVVPEKSDRETFWTAFIRNGKDITQIFSNFGLGAAAIKSLRQ